MIEFCDNLSSWKVLDLLYPILRGGKIVKSKGVLGIHGIMDVAFHYEETSF